ncbi:hypothetical protein HZA57_06925 [Candidatus Poribacteria bacterium]|nr:hypothetical protein [Candidatus Poribacteria bacterium]
MRRTADSLLRFAKSHRLELLMAGAFLLVSLALELRGVKHEYSDTATYVEPATALVTGHGFGLQGPEGVFRPVLNRTPGFPLLLAPFVLLPHGLHIYLWVQRLAVVAAFLFLPLTRAQLSGKQRIWFLLSRTVLLFSPTLMLNASALLSDTSFVVFLVMANVCIERLSSSAHCGRWLVGAGVFAGFAILIRPVGVYLPFVWFLAAAVNLLMTRDWEWVRRVSCAGLVALCFPLLWCARNFVHSGTFGYSPLTGYNLLLHRESHIRRNPVPPAGNSGEGTVCWKFIAEGGTVADAFRMLDIKFGKRDFEADAVAREVALSSIRTAPADYLRESISYGKNLILWPVDDLTLLSTLSGESDHKWEGLGTALRHRAFGVALIHIGIRFLRVAVFVFVPLLAIWWSWRLNRTLDARVILHAASAAYFVVATCLAIQQRGG